MRILEEREGEITYEKDGGKGMLTRERERRGRRR
jgi:hypothetical protein